MRAETRHVCSAVHNIGEVIVIENANHSAHAAPKARHVLEEFARALWHLRTPLALLSVLYLLLSVVMYYVGGPVDSGSGSPSSFAQTLNYCAMRALTIGHLNIVPTTIVGRVNSAMLGALGILFVGIVAAAAVRGVQEAVRHAGTHC